MGFFGIGGMQDNNGQNGPAAWVNGEVISSRDFNQEYEFTINQYRSKLGGQFDEKLLAALNIKQRIMERLFSIACSPNRLKMGHPSHSPRIGGLDSIASRIPKRRQI